AGRSAAAADGMSHFQLGQSSLPSRSTLTSDAGDMTGGHGTRPRRDGTHRTGQGERLNIMTYRRVFAAGLRGRASLIALGAGVALSATPALSQDETAEAPQTQSNEIIVTAQLREQNLQDVPLSISAVSGEQLEQRSQTSLTDITAQMPSLL